MKGLERIYKSNRNGSPSSEVERKEVIGKIPNHVGIIMDGNRRWAEQQGIARIDGHRKGINGNLEPVVMHASKRGIKELTIWALSPRNFDRGEEQINELFQVFRESFDQEMVHRLINEGVKIRSIGRVFELPEDIQEKIRKVEEQTKTGTKIAVNFAINYGGQEEIVDAVNKLSRVRIRRVTQERLARKMYVPDMTPVDLLIRPSGEQRTSGFMLWQAPYAELVFSDTLWPDFCETDLDIALREYANRDRRFGGNSQAT